MKIFISWSGNYSKECAEILRDWIKCTLQASEPWISSQDIAKGSLWFDEISDQLKDTKIGIVCLTKNNKEKPWILFEAGALAKGISTNRVCTFLINLKPSDLEAPLSQFNHTAPNREDMKSLLVTINNELGENALKDNIIDQIFDTYWPSFEDKFKKLVDSEPPINTDKPTRSKDEILEEILYTTRTMDKRIHSLERVGLRAREKGDLRSTLFSRRAMEQMIKEMVDKGAMPEEISEQLKGVAPSGFIIQRAQELYSNKQSTLLDSDDDDIRL